MVPNNNAHSAWDTLMMFILISRVAGCRRHLEIIVEHRLNPMQKWLYLVNLWKFVRGE